jgi:4-hydroxy-tetrahydrodipicolinate synthase
VKDCGGDPAKTLALIADGRLDVLCGEDLAMFGAMCAGASGAIAASAHLWPERFVAMARMLHEDHLADARAVWHTLVPLVRAMFAEPNPAPVKAALARRGWMANELRAPMTPVSDGFERELAQMVG